jgi:hypothetical protein
VSRGIEAGSGLEAPEVALVSIEGHGRGPATVLRVAVSLPGALAALVFVFVPLVTGSL